MKKIQYAQKIVQDLSQFLMAGDFIVTSVRTPWFAETLPLLLDRRDLDAAQIRHIVGILTEGMFDESEAAAWLTALRMKGESATEIAAAADALRERMIALRPIGAAVLDTCGTGGDGSDTFNISTAVALVVAAAGCAVVKHGNRSVSSRSGSADVLSALGVPIEAGPARRKRVWNDLDSLSVLLRIFIRLWQKSARCEKNWVSARFSICSDLYSILERRHTSCWE